MQRGGFDLRVAGSTLELHAPISAEAELCKELGPLCVTYGRCSPRFDARVSAPAIVGPGFSLPRARVEVTLTRSCSVLGFDASGVVPLGDRLVFVGSRQDFSVAPIAIAAPL